MQGDSTRPGRSDYLDFDLEIGIGTGRDYPVAVLDSPAGEARGNMHFPFDELVLENCLLTLQNALLRSGGKPRRTLSPEEQKVRDFGQALFEALFTPEVRICYDVSLREAARQGMGLRLKLRIQPPELAALPWEYLYHPGQREYVNLSTQTPVVRYLEGPQRVQPLLLAPPLRILGLIASPADLPSLDVERERERIEQAIRDLRTRGLLDLAWLPGQSWRDLQRAMRQGTWHIFHFIGHGGFDRNTGEGLIVLADGEGRSARFHAMQLARLLADHASLRLVLLNSCEGARGSEQDIFSSTAAVLVGRGIPAVLAMQYEITDRAAVEFARTFYEALADGMPIVGAVAEARKAISFAVANTVEWGTPVLYTRAAEGVLFEIGGEPAAEPPPEADEEGERGLEAERLARAKQERQEQVASHISAAQDHLKARRWSKAASVSRAVLEMEPAHPEATALLAKAEEQRERQQAKERARREAEARRKAEERARHEEKARQNAEERARRDAEARQAELVCLYSAACEAAEARDWPKAIESFEAVLREDPDYLDAAARLAQARALQKRVIMISRVFPRTAIRLVHTGEWQSVAELRGHKDTVYHVAFSPDGERVVTASSDKTARVWAAATGKVVAKLRGHTDGVSCAAFSPDGGLVVTASADGRAQLWEATTGYLVTKLKAHARFIGVAWYGVTSAVFSPDGRLVATASTDGKVRLWVVATGERVAELGGRRQSALRVAFSPDGNQLITADRDGMARMREVQTGKVVAELRGSTAGLRDAAFSSDGKLAVTASWDGTARIWDVATEQIVRALRVQAYDGLQVLKYTGLQTAALHPNGKWLLTATHSKEGQVYDVATVNVVAVLRGHEGSLYSAVFSPDGTLAATASSDGTARIWEVPSE
jgi:CHAT domain-containing protein/DNA-binding beta-propeller fold protein YncE